MSSSTPPDDERAPTPVAEAPSENDADTDSLTGQQLDALLDESRESRESRPELVDGVTAELTGEETDRLLRLTRKPPLPNLKRAPVDEASQDGDDLIVTARMKAHRGSSPGIVSPSAPEPAPSGDGVPPVVARAKLVSGDVVWPSKRASGRIVVLAAVGAALVAGALALGLFSSTESPVAIPSAAPTVAPTPAPPPIETAPPKEEAAADKAARAALLRLRDGLRECVRRSAMMLPGNSPPVPSNLTLTAGGGYTSVAADWKTPVWSCAQFHVDEPMRFQLQWQLAKGSSEGIGIAWIDDDGDGHADRALAFHATMRLRGQMEVGDVAPLDPKHAVTAVSY